LEKEPKSGTPGTEELAGIEEAIAEQEKLRGKLPDEVLEVTLACNRPSFRNAPGAYATECGPVCRINLSENDPTYGTCLKSQNPSTKFFTLLNKRLMA